jgi:hypothetical protein
MTAIKMMKRQAVMAMAAIALGTAGASLAEARTVQASVQSVTQAFVDAVYQYCVPSVMSGTPLAELSTEGRPQSLEAASANRAASLGGAAWAIAGVGEIVVLQEEPETPLCRVSAYGPPVAPVFGVLARILAQPTLGFVEVETGRPFVPRTVARKFESRANGILYTIVLSGNEPGAPGRMSRFSTLMATISSRPIEQDAETPQTGEER